MRGRRLRPAGAIVALLGGGLLAGAAADGPAARQPLIRKATVAGQFYPAEPQRLRGAIAAYLAAAPAPLAEPPVALVVPHAGYVFSGQIAADGWRQAMGRDYEVVVLLATNHRVPPFRGVSVFPGGGYETPLGLIGTDHEVVKTLQAAEPLVTWRPEAHAEEHSEEVQLPFLRVVLPEARLVSAVVGSADPEVAASFGRALAKVLAGRRALIVASSDLSHYPSQADAAVVDRRTLAAIASLDTAAVGRALRAAGERPGLATCACGEGPVLAALTAARALGASRGVVLGYANSGDTVAGEPERVVGYGAVALTRGAPGADTRALAPPPVGPATAPLGEAERSELLALARATLEQLYATDTLPLPRPASPLLRRPQGAFVTLRRGGELRGCVGQLTSEAPLALTVARMAVGAARNDRRFLPVAAAELPELTIEISVLTPPARVRSPAAIQPGRDGVLLEQSGRQAVFLPQVATEQGWGRDELLSQLCLKAGLAPGCWRQGARLSTFQADVFGTAQDRPLNSPRSGFASLFAIGLVTLLGQVVALRELLVASFGSELVYLLGLAGLLLGTALGALLGPLARRSPGERVEGQVRAGLLLYALLLPAAVVVARALRRLLRGTPGAYLPLGAQLAGLALVLLPLGLLAGLLFQRAAAVALARGRTLAGAYAVESAGGFAGGALATLLLAAGFSNLRAGLLAALVALTAALLPRPRPRWLLVTAGPALLALGAALAFTPALDFALTRWHHPALVLTRDTPYGRVSVERMAGQLALFTNDVLTFESEGTAAEELAQVAALSVAAPRSLLLLGGGAEGFVAELLAHRPDRLVVVELDAVLLAAVRELLPEEARAALAAPAVETVIADPRRFLARPGSYDLIVAALSEPDSGQTNRYYSREFFAACARRLAPGGVLAFRLRGGENIQTPLLAERNASVARALAAVFPYRLVLPGTSHLFLAAATPLPDDPARLAARLAVRGVEPRLVSAPYLDYLFQNDRRRQIAEQLAVSRVPENRDARPVCYQLTLQLWLARLLPGRALRPPVPAGASPVGSLLAPWPLAAGVLLLATLLAARRREGARRALLAAAAGGLGMILEGALLLGYQAARGVLYQDLGLLLTAFMGGLAAGAAAADRRLAATPSRRAGAAVVLAAATVAGLTALVLTAGEGGLLPAFLLLLAAGGATGALFALATRTRDPERAIGPLYAADLLGGAAGSLLGSLWLLPLLGLPLSAGLAALGAFALLFLL